MELALLRLQDIWLGKLITSGLLIPAGRLSAKRGYSSSAEVARKMVTPRLLRQEILNGVGAEGVGVKFPIVQ